MKKRVTYAMNGCFVQQQIIMACIHSPQSSEILQYILANKEI